MAIEIERKFLLKNEAWKANANEGTIIKQGYLNLDVNRNVRVRTKGAKGFLTIKGKSKGISRTEFEYEIPKEEAEQLLLMCHKPLIEKTRYELIENNKTWEIDIFEGDNKGLMIAEIELSNENETIEKPSWLGKEVSDDTRYYNASLIKLPYKDWQQTT